MPTPTLMDRTDRPVSRQVGAGARRALAFVLAAFTLLALSAPQCRADESLQHFMSGTQPAELIQGADAYGELSGSPPLAPLLSGGKPVGYAYHDGLHSDWVASPSQQALYNAAHGVWLWPPTDNGRPD